MGVLSWFFFFKQKTAYEIMPSLVGSEMCIRDSVESVDIVNRYAYLRDGYGKLEIGIRLKQSFLEGLQRCSK